MDAKRVGRLFGWFFVATFVFSIPARLLWVHGFGASWSDMHFVPGDTSKTSLQLGAVLDFFLIIANVATAVVLYPVARRVNERLALGYVVARIMESAFIAVGIVAGISAIGVIDALPGASAASASTLAIQGNTLADIYEWTFQFGPGLVVTFGNGLILGYLMYRSELVPRRMAIFGLVGGPLLMLSFFFILFGVYDNGEGPSGLLALPEIIWEASLAVYASVKGFKETTYTEA